MFATDAFIDSSSGRQLLAQSVPENTQQNPVVPNTNQQILGNPVQNNPVVPNTNQQFLGNTAQTNPIVPNTNQQSLGNPAQTNSVVPNTNQQFLGIPVQPLPRIYLLATGCTHDLYPPTD